MMTVTKKLLAVALLAIGAFLISWLASFGLGAAVAHAQPAETGPAGGASYDPANPPTHMPPSDEVPPAPVADGPAQTDAIAAQQEAHGHIDPSTHFNFFNFSWSGKDVMGGPLGDGKMVDPHSGNVIPEEEAMSPPFVLMVLNFIIFVGILAWKGGPIFKKLAADRHDLIKTALDEAAQLREQAASKLSEYESRLAAADAEIKKMVEGIRTDAEADKQRILATAEKQVAIMKKDAEQRIAAEIELARVALTREVTAAAAVATEKLLREKMNPSDQQKLVTTFLSGLASSPSSKEAR